jgi:hypothetical protein
MSANEIRNVFENLKGIECKVIYDERFLLFEEMRKFLSFSILFLALFFLSFYSFFSLFLFFQTDGNSYSYTRQSVGNVLATFLTVFHCCNQHVGK